jgi:hypothetical protein
MAKRKEVSKAIRSKISKAMKGNSNAEKWTEDVVKKILNSMISFASGEYEIETSSTAEEGYSSKGPNEKKIIKKAKRKLHLKTGLLVEYKIWNVNWFGQMREKFQDNKSVSCLLDAVDMICMTNTYNDIANGAINPAVGKMNLSTHYKWSDSIKQDIKQDVSGSVDFSLPQPSEEAMRQWKKANEHQEDDNE